MKHAGQIAVAVACSATLVVSLGGCLSDDVEARERYCAENPYAEPCPLGDAADSGGTTTIEIETTP